MFVRNEKIDFDYIDDIIKSKINNFKDYTEYTINEIEKILELDINISKTKLIAEYIKPIFKSHGLLDYRYWDTRGYDNPQDMISKEQSKRSPRCIEYWIKKGYTEECAKMKVKELQKGFNNICQEKYKDNKDVFNLYRVETYTRKGYTKDEAEKKILEKKLKDKIVQTREYRLLNGFTDKDIDNINKKKANKKDKNPMYKKTPSIKCGAGVSGKYKDYYFRSTLEYYFLKSRESENIIQCDIPMTESPYMISIDNKNYTPDFIINNTIYDIKNSFSFKNDFSFYQKVIDYYKNKKIEYVILDENDFKNFNILNMYNDYMAGFIDFASETKLNKMFKLKENYEKDIKCNASRM